MVHSLFKSCIYLILICSAAAISTTCNQKSIDIEDKIPALYTPPATILLRKDSGYIINAFTGDSIHPIINSRGDSVTTGVPIAIKATAIQPKIIKHTKVAPIEKGAITRSQPNKYLITKSNLVRIDESKLTKLKIGIDSTAFTLINSIGDTIPTGVPIPLTGKVVACRYTNPVYTLAPRMKENALYDIQYLDEDQGLNAPSMATIMQDKKGNLWIGGSNGVSRYDGVTLRNFNTQQGLCNDQVQCIIEDMYGYLWIGTRGGLSRYDGYSFINYTEEEGLGNNFIFSIVENKENNYFWLGTFGGGICKFTPSDDGRTAEIIHYTKKEGLSNNRISSIVQDPNGLLWCGTSGGGVNLFDPPGKSTPGSFTRYTTKEGLPDNWVVSITKDHNKHLWFATFGGAVQYIPPTPQTDPIFRIFNKLDGLSDNMTWSIIEDSDYNIWVSTYNAGVNCIHMGQSPEDETSITVVNEEMGLTHNYVWQIFEDSSHNLWFASIGGGIMRYNKNSFHHLTQKEGICGNDIQSFMEDNYGNIWIGDNGKGFSLYQPDKGNIPGTFSNYKLDSLYDGGNNRNRIFAFLQDKKENIWFVTKGGIYKCRTDEKGSVFDFTFFQLDLPREAILYGSCLEDYSGSLWFGSDGGGITKFIPSETDSSYTFFQYTEKEGLASNYVSSILEDEYKNIWISTMGGGVSCLTPGRNRNPDSIIHFTEKEGLPSNVINCMYKEPQSKIWFGTTGQGVFMFNSTRLDKEIQITTMREQEGLTNTTVWSITGDPEKKDQLWTGTGKGLFLISLTGEQESQFKIHEIGKADGLKRTDFDINGVLFDSRKKIWWGTGKGIEILDSKNFKLSDKTPTPQIRDVEINGEFIDYNNLKDKIKQGIDFDSVARFENYPQNSSFSHKQNHLIFHYSAVDWAAPHKIRYSYLIDDLNDTWSHPSPETKADYRNLPSGTHTFKVRAIGESQKWSEPFEYTFTIRPPWWYSWWAFVMYSCFGGFILYRTYRFQLDRKLAIADRKRLVELDHIKNRLYTNITHEFRTPLTLIHGPVTQALSRNSTLEQKDIQSIHRQSERLQELINQMLELQKLEAGMLKPNYAYGEIIQMLRYLFGSFESWAREKNISMIFSSSLQEVYMDFDKEKLTQIITNLVNNAIKHTPRSGKIALSINAAPSGESLLIQVADTGVGINSEDLPFVFDRFYQSKRAAVGGTGIGLAIVKNLAELLGGSITVESEPDKGATFKLKLPITKHAPTPASAPQVVTPMMQENEDEESRFATKDAMLPGKPLVLVIEDHPEVSQYIVSCLSSAFNTLTAMNGDEGLQVALEKVPDLIISDVMMPGKDGFELCRILKSNIKTSHVPIILLTGRSDHEAMMAGIEHGADAYVVKPFDPDELILRVKKLLELRTNLSLHYRQLATLNEVEPEVSVSPVENEFLKKLRSFIEEHINDMRFNMDMLCHQMAMSHAQLHRKVTALTGESVGKFVRAIRLSRAKELLKKSDLTISEIAYETGFSEPGYFTKVFSKEINMSPSEYRDNPT